MVSRGAAAGECARAVSVWHACAILGAAALARRPAWLQEGHRGARSSRAPSTSGARRACHRAPPGRGALPARTPSRGLPLSLIMRHSSAPVKPVTARPSPGRDAPPATLSRKSVPWPRSRRSAAGLPSGGSASSDPPAEPRSRYFVREGGATGDLCEPHRVVLSSSGGWLRRSSHQSASCGRRPGDRNGNPDDNVNWKKNRNYIHNCNDMFCRCNQDSDQIIRFFPFERRVRGPQRSRPTLWHYDGVTVSVRFLDQKV